MIPFYSKFPDLAVQETRSVKVRGDDDLPDGEYGFIEFYCEEPACDCRRVVVNVVTPHTGSTGWATISFGWETLQFYQDRLGSLEDAAVAKGPSLDPLNPQTKYAPALLRLFRFVLTTLMLKGSRGTITCSKTAFKGLSRRKDDRENTRRGSERERGKARIILMAGIEAANLIRKQTGLQHWLEATADILEAHSIAKRLGHKGEIDRLHAIALATLEASTILKENRPALEALACALIKQTNLSGEEARQIINAAGKISSLTR